MGLAATGFALAAVSASIGPAAGLSCAGGGLSMQETVDQTVADDGTIFVGTLVSTTNDGTWATFAVDEVWAGDVPDEVDVKGDYDHRSGIQIAGYEAPVLDPGVRYLVMPTKVLAQDDPMFDSSEGEYELPLCSAPPAPFSEALAVYRPSSARIIDRIEPVEVTGAVAQPSEGQPWLAIGAGALVLVAGIGGAVVWGRRRRAVDVEVAEANL
jgi:hypothetical protein